MAQARTWPWATWFGVQHTRTIRLPYLPNDAMLQKHHPKNFSVYFVAAKHFRRSADSDSSETTAGWRVSWNNVCHCNLSTWSCEVNIINRLSIFTNKLKALQLHPSFLPLPLPPPLPHPLLSCDMATVWSSCSLINNLVPVRACITLDQLSRSSMPLPRQLKTRRRNFWCVHACESDILDEVNKFTTANQIWPSFWWAFSWAQGSQVLVLTKRITASEDEIFNQKFSFAYFIYIYLFNYLEFHIWSLINFYWKILQDKTSSPGWRGREKIQVHHKLVDCTHGQYIS